MRIVGHPAVTPRSCSDALAPHWNPCVEHPVLSFSQTHSLDVACASSRSICPKRNWQRNIPPSTERAMQATTIANSRRCTFRNRMKRPLSGYSDAFDIGVSNSEPLLNLSTVGQICSLGFSSLNQDQNLAIPLLCGLANRCEEHQKNVMNIEC